MSLQNQSKKKRTILQLKQIPKPNGTQNQDPAQAQTLHSTGSLPWARNVVTVSDLGHPNNWPSHRPQRSPDCEALPTELISNCSHNPANPVSLSIPPKHQVLLMPICHCVALRTRWDAQNTLHTEKGQSVPSSSGTWVPKQVKKTPTAPILQLLHWCVLILSSFLVPRSPSFKHFS